MKATNQIAMDERIVEDKELEGLLETRAHAKAEASEASKTAQKAHESAMAALDKLQLADGDVIRVGRFRIERKDSEVKHVEFDTEAKVRLVIGAGDDE